MCTPENAVLVEILSNTEILSISINISVEILILSELTHRIDEIPIKI